LAVRRGLLSLPFAKDFLFFLLCFADDSDQLKREAEINVSKEGIFLPIGTTERKK